MASTVPDEPDFFDDEEDDDDSEFDSDDDYPHNDPPPPPTLPSPTVPDPNPFTSPPAPISDLVPISIHTPSAISAFNGSLPALPAPQDRKRRRTSEESRRMFQKLWKDEDEIAILQGFLDFTTQRGTTQADYQYDTGPFFDQIRTSLQLEFNKNQLVEKLRRLKRKYRNAVSRIAAGKESVFKSPHDRATFEISRKIWSSSFKRVRKRRPGRPPVAQAAELYLTGPVEMDPVVKEEAAVPVEVTLNETVVMPAVTPAVSTFPAPVVTSSIEETLRSCLSPLFKEMIQCVVGGTGGNANGGFALNLPMQLNLPGAGAVVEERWKKQQILELEVFLKRTELVQDQIKAALEELRSPAAESS